MPPFISPSLSSIHSYTRYGSIYEYKNATVTKETGGLLICKESSLQFILGGNMFSCENGEYISILLVCDGENDCKDFTDEKWCKNMAYCSHLFYFNSITKGCVMYNFHDIIINNITVLPNMSHCAHDIKSMTQDSINHFGFSHIFLETDLKKNSENQHTFTCDTNVNISLTMVNDFIADCGITGEDEYILIYTTSNIYFNCFHKNQIPCRAGHPRYYDISEICTYRLNSMNQLIPCKTGEHLQNCRDFECNMMFKCPKYYCIPWEYVCDEKWDCPYGNDEDKKELSYK